MEYRPITDPLNPEYHYLFTGQKKWHEEVWAKANEANPTRPLIDPIKHPIITRVLMWSFWLAIVSGIIIGLASPQGF